MDSRLAWLPLPVFAIALAFFSERDFGVQFGSPVLLATVNLAFLSVTSLFVMVLISRSFLLYATPDLLLLGCGALAWGCTAFASVVANPQDINSVVTIHNCGALLAGLLHVGGSLTAGTRFRIMGSRSLVLTAAYAATLSVIAALMLITLSQEFPVFFIAGKGGTPIRLGVLMSAVVAFCVTGIVMRVRRHGSLSPFSHWYSIAMLLIALGLFGVSLQSTFGTPVNWTARFAQYLGGVYMLAAALMSAREATAWQISLTDTLSRTQHRYESLFHLAGDGIAIHEIQAGRAFGRILEANQALCQLLGYTESELRELNPNLLYEDFTAAEPDQDVDNPTPREVTLRRHDNTALIAEVSTRYFREHDQWVAMSIVRDLTGRKSAESQLRELAQRLTWHVENTPLAVIEWGADMRIARWSPGAERLFGWTAAEVLGKRMEDFRWIYREDEADVRSVSDDLQSGSVRNFLANRNYRKDGSIVYCEWYNSSLLDEFGNLRSILSLVLDVTPKTEAETALRRVNAELEQFAYAVSHDLQEPLRNITIFSELLKRKHSGSLDADAMRNLQFVVDGARQIDHLLTGLRSYLHVGAHAVGTENTDASAALQDALASLQSALQKQGAVIESGDLPQVAVRAVHLQQLFQNLIGNALKFHAAEPPHIRVSAEPQDDMIRFAVTDNGIGIEAQYAAQIFGVFRRLHPQTKYEGSGIGLAICQKIVERYHGRIWVESSGKGGSTFYFTLPAVVDGNQTSATSL